jgi:hypothetical protein
VASSKLDRKWGVWPRLPAQPLTAFQPRRRDREKLLAREIWTWRHGEHESAHSVRSFRCHRHAGLLRALEDRSPWFILGFAGACALGSAYAWPFGVIEAVWAGVAVYRWRLRIVRRP